MKTATLSHSDQIVATLAKLPIGSFGTSYTKEVALALAHHMNKAKGWSACLYLRTLAATVGCTTRTVRNALRRLESLGFIQTVHRKHDQIANWNLASVYKLGQAVLSLFRTPSKPLPAKSLTSSKQKQSNKDPARSSSSGQSTSCTVRSPEEWANRKQAGMEHNRNALEKIKALFGRVR